ncbi:zinc finger HIT domain-containing protein 2-like isoform X2 [Schistocerca gregaria]|nr:zinc finger HIT domain-containing protein 2-like isoform X2 [Schistocerca gregaria]
MEEFYRQQFISAIRSQRPATEEEKRELLDILDRESIRRRQDEDEMKRLFGDLPADDSAEDARESKEPTEISELSDLDPYDPRLSEHVPPSLVSEMNEWIKSGLHSSVIKPWIPWWYRNHLTPAISVSDEFQEAGSQVNDETYQDDAEAKLELEPASSPQILSSVPPISSLTKSRPSPLNLFNITNVVYAYVYAKLIYNGDWEGDVESEVVDVLLSTSLTLSKNLVYQNATTACQSAIEASVRLVYARQTPRFCVSIIRDVVKIFANGSPFVQACLSELYRLFSKQPNANIHKKQGCLLKNVARKLLFMISWCKDQADIQPYLRVCRELEAMLLEKEADMAASRLETGVKDKKIEVLEDESREEEQLCTRA